MLLHIIEMTELRLRRSLRLCLPTCLLLSALILTSRCAKALQTDASIVTHAPSIGTLIADIEAGRSADAQYTARWYGDSTLHKIHEHCRGLMAEENSGNDLAAKRKRFVFLDFYFRHCEQPDQQSNSQAEMREDFLKLSEELQIAADALPATPASLELLERCSRPDQKFLDEVSLPQFEATHYRTEHVLQSDNDWHRGQIVMVKKTRGAVCAYAWKR